mmetsp:Transcript_44022/g.137882  ORF Transcript_44022/g.137882 Transcript_44022/m.137882 type:complete len:264 (+) Transcript_44022:901-1692(+)
MKTPSSRPWTVTSSRPSMSGNTLRSQWTCASDPGSACSPHRETLRSKAARMVCSPACSPKTSPCDGDIPTSFGGLQRLCRAHATHVTEVSRLSSQRSRNTSQRQPRGRAEQEQASNAAPQTAAAHPGCTGQAAQLTPVALPPRSLRPWHRAAAIQEQLGARAHRQGEAHSGQVSTGSGATTPADPPGGVGAGAAGPVGGGGGEAGLTTMLNGRRTSTLSRAGAAAVMLHRRGFCDCKGPDSETSHMKTSLNGEPGLSASATTR